MKKKINISGIDPLSFTGMNDQNLRFIEMKFDSKIVLRGSDMNIEGKENQIKKIELLVAKMMLLINRRGHVSKEDLENLADDEGVDFNIEDIEDKDSIILYSHRGPIVARTKGQKKYLKEVLKNDIVFAVGPAGTGKTYQAVALAVNALKNKEVDKIVITRPAVEAGERLGFLPGDLKEKIDPYLTPLYDALREMIPNGKLRGYLDSRTIEVAPLAYMRGRTLNNSFMILDEAQNATRMQMKMFLTRLGVTSKAIITGDITQIDLPPNDKSGLIDAVSILRGVDGISIVEFDSRDVVRHKLVKNIIKAYSDNDNKKEK